MFIRKLKHGLSTLDSVAGTVSWCGYAGSYVELDEADDDGKPLKAFVEASLEKGQRVLLSIRHYDKKRDNYFCNLESSLGGPEAIAVEEPVVSFIEQDELYVCAA